MIRSAVGVALATYAMLKYMLLEIGIVVLSIVCFVALEAYVVGCERV